LSPEEIEKRKKENEEIERLNGSAQEKWRKLSEQEKFYMIAEDK
jgi:hypothetical protein